MMLESIFILFIRIFFILYFNLDDDDDDDDPKCISGYHISFDFISFSFPSFFATYLAQKKDLFFLFKLCAYFIEFTKT